MKKNKKKSNPIWGTNFNKQSDPLLEEINSSIDFDKRLAMQDIKSSKVHCLMLKKQKIITTSDYKSIIKSINEIVKKIETNIGKELPIGVCHPGIHSIHTGLIKNSPNCDWINNKPFQKDLREAIGREIFCENDANCFTLSEAIDGSGKHYKIVFGIILGSGVGGGLVIDKKIVSGPHGITGEWGHNQLPLVGKESKVKKTNLQVLKCCK